MDRWPHQIHGVQETLRAHVDGFPVVVLTSPTGGGKSLMMCDLIDDSLSKRQRSVLYTNRRMLMEQTQGLAQAWHPARRARSGLGKLAGRYTDRFAADGTFAVNAAEDHAPARRATRYRR